MDAYAVIAAFLIGIGPGAAVQPCPKHRATHGDEPGTTRAALHGARGTAADHGHADRGDTDRHQGSSHADGAGAATPSHPHSDGPCDCLGICLTCSGPAQVASAAPAAQPTLESQTPQGKRRDSGPAPDPAAYLKPYAQPPPA